MGPPCPDDDDCFEKLLQVRNIIVSALREVLSTEIRSLKSDLGFLLRHAPESSETKRAVTRLQRLNQTLALYQRETDSQCATTPA